MFKTILVPTDGTALAIKAVRAAVELARLHQGQIIALSVAEPMPAMALAAGEFGLPGYADEDDDARVAAALKCADYVVQAAHEAGVSAQALVAISAQPHEEIIRLARDHHCDVIVMASHGRKGLNRVIMGSQTEKVLLNSNIPVLVFRP